MPIHLLPTMKEMLCSCIILFYFQGALFSQTISGKVFETPSKTPIAYASIYIPNKTGVNCDENGNFQLNLDKISLTDTITLSCVGYKTLMMPKSEFIKNTEFFLAENTELLNAITIKPTGKEMILGKKESSGAITIEFVTDEKNRRDSIQNVEIGVILDNNRPLILQEVGFYLQENTFDELKFRLNIYDTQHGLPNEQLIQKQTHITIPSKKSGWFTFDLTNQNILAKADFICTIEVLNVLPRSGKFAMPASFSILKRKTLGRGFSKGKWIKAPVNLSIYAKAIALKE